MSYRKRRCHFLALFLLLLSRAADPRLHLPERQQRAVAVAGILAAHIAYFLLVAHGYRCAALGPAEEQRAICVALGPRLREHVDGVQLLSPALPDGVQLLQLLDEARRLRVWRAVLWLQEFAEAASFFICACWGWLPQHVRIKMK